MCKDELTSEDKQILENMFEDANSFLWNVLALNDMANMDEIQKMSNKFKAVMVKVKRL